MTAEVTREKLKFAYDGLGRRIAKETTAWNGRGWKVSRHILFLYDGRTTLAELDGLAGSSAVRTYCRARI